LKIISVTPAGSSRVVRVAVSPQRRYVLQSSPDFQTWTDDGAPLTATGPELQFIVNLPATGRSFYRVRADYQFP
jgi:hypothetical protein